MNKIPLIQCTEIAFKVNTLTQKWKQRELGFWKESSDSKAGGERERELSCWCME